MALTSDDVVAINQLYAAYCHAVDDHDGKAFSACFLPDGSMDIGGHTISGRDGLATFATDVPAGLRHAVSNVHVEGDDDEARGRAYVLVYGVAEGGPSMAVSGRYRDSLRRVDGEWLFDERHFTPDA